MYKLDDNFIKKIEDLNFCVELFYFDDDSYDISIPSPLGQDFSFVIQRGSSYKEFKENLRSYFEGFDVSFETYLWLDNTGHGKNGAPYDMKDVYDDMLACKNNIKLFADELNKYEKNKSRDER